METFKWTFKEKGSNWVAFFNQYGITQITKEDFVNILKLQEILSIAEVTDEKVEHDEEYFKLENEMYQQIQKAESFHVPDQVGYTKTRGAAQAAFAREVKANYRFKCCITGISTTDFLVASHIKPWRADKDNRLNPANGLCLSSILDRAFDKGYISFDDKYRLIIATHADIDKILKEYLEHYEQVRINTYGGKDPDLDFIKWHRENIFLDSI